MAELTNNTCNFTSPKQMSDAMYSAIAFDLPGL